MTNEPDRRARRGRLAVLRPVFLPVLLAVLCLAAPALLVETAADAATSDAGDHDASLARGDCELLGRAFVPHEGCSRARCESGAVLWRRTYGAEACALRRQPAGYGFVATVDVRQCRALHRRWIPQVNYCASEPDRRIEVLHNAPQCVRPATVYVTLAETEGHYDECLTSDRVAELVQQSVVDGSSLEAEVDLRSSTQCPYRPGEVFVDGACVPDPGFHPAGGGVLMVGDSLTWRGSDELGRLRPSFTIDGEPSRPPTELPSRLSYYRSGHGDPSGLIVELGTVPARGFGRHDLVGVLRDLPRTTSVMLVAPYHGLRTDPVAVTLQSRKVDGWMRGLARSRVHTCLADWPAYVRAHPGLLQDGVHAKHRAERRWAGWIASQWGRC